MMAAYRLCRKDDPNMTEAEYRETEKRHNQLSDAVSAWMAVTKIHGEPDSTSFHCGGIDASQTDSSQIDTSQTGISQAEIWQVGTSQVDNGEYGGTEYTVRIPRVPR